MNDVTSIDCGKDFLASVTDLIVSFLLHIFHPFSSFIKLIRAYLYLPKVDWRVRTLNKTFRTVEIELGFSSEEFG